MLITIISMIILIAGIVFIIIGERSYYNEDAWFGSGTASLLLGALGTLICIIAIMCNCIPYETNYANAQYEREVLEYRLENQTENIVGNELLYNNIVEFNNNLRSCKKYSESPWTNWFYNAKIATLDYIEIEGLNAKGEGK